MNLYLCETCGHVAFNNKPDNCPVCGDTKFTLNNEIFKESEEKSPEASVKHVPQVSINKNQTLFEDKDDCIEVKVRVGEVVHPSEEKHFIQFIDFYVDDKFVKRAHLSSGVYPASIGYIKSGEKLTVVENCNIHGWWYSEVKI